MLIGGLFLLQGGELLCHVGQVGGRCFTEPLLMFLQKRGEARAEHPPAESIGSRLDVTFGQFKIVVGVFKIVMVEPFLDSFRKLAPLVCFR